MSKPESRPNEKSLNFEPTVVINDNATFEEASLRKTFDKKLGKFDSIPSMRSSSTLKPTKTQRQAN